MSISVKVPGAAALTASATISSQVQFDHWPLLVGENDDCDCSTLEILLVANVFVGAEDQDVTNVFCILN